MRMILVLCLVLFTLKPVWANSTGVNPYENYKHKPINWLVFSIIGNSTALMAAASPNMNPRTRSNLIEAGTIVFTVSAPLTIVKFIKHYRYLAWEEKHADTHD